MSFRPFAGIFRMTIFDDMIGLNGLIAVYVKSTVMGDLGPLS